MLGLIREDKNLTNRFLRNSSSIESIRKEIEGRTTIREKVSTSIDLPLSNECKRILAYAAEEAERLNHRHIGTEHLLLGILREEKCVAAEILHERGLRLNAIREELARSVVDRQTLVKPKETPLLSEFSRDLTQAAMDGVLDPLVGRDAEIDRVIQILCRRTKNNPVLIGDPGVGKTAIVEGLAQRIVDGEVPSFLADKRILVLDLSLIVAGTKYRGQFEERLKTIMKELVDNPNTVVFIDELHTLVGAGSAEGSLDAANILKPALSRGEIQCIGATTPAEYRKSIEKDRSLERRFQAVKVGAPSENEAVRILQGVKPRYEKFHMVNYTDEAIESAVYLSNRYIPDRFLPDKAIDLLDEAGARVKLRQATLAFGDDGHSAPHQVHRGADGKRHFQQGFRKGGALQESGTARARKSAPCSREIQYQRNDQHGRRDEGGHRRCRFALDRRSGQLDQRRRNATAVADRRRVASANRQSGSRLSMLWRARSGVRARV